MKSTNHITLFDARYYNTDTTPNADIEDQIKEIDTLVNTENYISNLARKNILNAN